MDNENKYKSIIDQECPACFRKDECMLFSDRHAGVELCLGPFKDQERQTKIREDNEREKQRANLRGYVSEYVRELFKANVDLLKHGQRRDSGDSDEDD
jgi:hypothetical protein